MKKILIIIVFLSFGSIYAGGYRVALQGQRMLGMAHAGLSVFKNAETAFFNPAGIAFLDNKLSISFGANAILSTVKFQNKMYNWQYETDNPVGTPFYLSLAYQLSDHFNAGLSVYTPFGSSSVWNEWAGSEIVNDISMKVFYVQPSLAYKFNDKLSIGASFILAFGEVSYNKNINRYLTDEQGNKTNVQLESGMTNAFGYGLSMAYRPCKELNIGVNYRSSIIIDAQDGEATFNNVPGFLADKLKTTGFSAELPMPAELGVGFSFKPIDKILVAIDYNYTYWDIYKELKIVFDSKDLPPSISEKNYHNTSTIRIGAEYQATGNLFIRAGYYLDESPLSKGHLSPETPSLTTDNFTFGVGYQTKKLAVDLSVLMLYGRERTDYTTVNEGLSNYKFGGSYINNAIIPGIGISYNIK